MKNIKDFDNFAGQDGCLIIDGLNASVSGGKVTLGTGGLGIYPGATYSQIIVKTDDITIEKSDGGDLQVKNPVPDPEDEDALANDGDVLTYSDTDGIVWAAPQGGGGGDPLPDDVVWTIKTGLTPDYPQKTDVKIECYITGFENGKAKLSWVWKLKPDASGSFEGSTQSGAFDW